MGAPAAARVWTVTQGDTVIRTLSEGEAIIERRRLLAADDSITPQIFAPGTYPPAST